VGKETCQLQAGTMNFRANYRPVQPAAADENLQRPPV